MGSGQQPHILIHESFSFQGRAIGLPNEIAQELLPSQKSMSIPDLGFHLGCKRLQPEP
jgi:hypothetical protein